MGQKERILLSHGSGGRRMQELIRRMVDRLGNSGELARLEDAARVELPGVSIAFTTDSYVVSPRFFPGGDIGRLAVCGTVNDLAMLGAKPLVLSLGLVIEEGLAQAELERVVESVAKTAAEAEVAIVTGDTKVVERGGADGLFVNTAGIGVIPQGIRLSGHNLRPGDKLLVSGTLGEHELAVVTCRKGIELEWEVVSDVAPLNGLVQEMLAASPHLHALRDLTRGGLATVLAELAEQSEVGIVVYEEALPVQPAVRGACELLGLDVLYLACEGRLVASVRADAAGVVLEAMRRHPLGRNAQLVGEVVAEHPGVVRLKTSIGGMRILDMLAGEQLPRIC